MSDGIFRKEALERLSSPEQLDQLMQIVTPRSWLPLATLGGLISVGVLWSVFGRIPVTTTSHAVLVHPEDDASQLIGVAHFDAGEIAQIEPGMPVLLIPDVEGNKQSAGGIYGSVSYVQSPEVMTLEGIRELDDPAAPTTIEVIIDLEEDPDSGTGYRWSASSNQMFPLAGMPAAARVTLDEKAPIAFVLPFLEAQ